MSRCWDLAALIDTGVLMCLSINASAWEHWLALVWPVTGEPSCELMLICPGKRCQYYRYCQSALGNFYLRNPLHIRQHIVAIIGNRLCTRFVDLSRTLFYECDTITSDICFAFLLICDFTPSHICSHYFFYLHFTLVPFSRKANYHFDYFAGS